MSCTADSLEFPRGSVSADSANNSRNRKLTTNVPGWQQQHSHNGSLAAVDRRRRCRSSSRKIDPDTLVSFCSPKSNGYDRFTHRKACSSRDCVSASSSSSSGGGPKDTDDCDDHGGGGGGGDDDDDPVSGVLFSALRSSFSSRSKHTFRRSRPPPCFLLAGLQSS